MALADKLGQSYGGVKEQVKIKTLNIKLGDVNFDLKVRILLKREMEDLVNAIASPTKERVQELYEQFAKPIKKSIEDGGEGFLEALNKDKQMITVMQDDILIEGSSVRNLANFTAMWELKVEKYFALIQSETGEKVNETFAQISEELPESAIKFIVEEIESVIKPTYKDVKKN